MQTIDHVDLVVNNVGNELRPDEIIPEDNEDKYVKLDHITYSTGPDIFKDEDVLPEVNGVVNEVGENIKLKDTDPPESGTKLVRVKDITVNTEDLYSKEEYESNYRKGKLMGYNMSNNEFKISVLDDINIKADEYTNIPIKKIFPDEQKYPGKEYVHEVVLDMSELRDVAADISEFFPMYGNNVITSNNNGTVDGEFKVPEGYSGWNTFKVRVPSSVKNKNVSPPNNVITQDGLYLYDANGNPDGYSGWNNFAVRCPKSVHISSAYPQFVDDVITANNNPNDPLDFYLVPPDAAGWASFRVQVPQQNSHTSNISDVYPEFVNNVINRNVVINNLPAGSVGWNNFEVVVPTIEINKAPVNLITGRNDNLITQNNLTFNLSELGEVNPPYTGWSDFTVRIPQNVTEVNNAPVSLITGRADNRITSNGSFNIANTINVGNYTGWSNFVVDITPDYSQYVPRENLISNYTINVSNFTDGTGNKTILFNNIENNAVGFLDPLYINTDGVVNKNLLWVSDMNDPFVINVADVYELDTGVPQPLQMSKIINNEMITKAGLFGTPFINTGFLVDKRNLKNSNELNKFVIRADNFEGNFQDPQEVIIFKPNSSDRYNGVYGPLYLNTQNMLNMNTQTIVDNYFRNNYNDASTSEQERTVVTYRDVYGVYDINENYVFESRGKDFSMRAENNKYFQSYNFSVKLADIIIPPIEIKNQANDVIWSPFREDERGYVTYDMYDYDLITVNNGNNLIPMTGISSVRFRFKHVDLPRTLAGSNTTIKNYTIQDYNDSQGNMGEKFNALKSISFKLKNFERNNLVSVGNNRYLLQLSEYDLNSGYIGFNTDITIPIRDDLNDRITISKLNRTIKSNKKLLSGAAVFQRNNLSASININNEEVNKQMEFEDTFDIPCEGLKNIDVQVDIPIMEEVIVQSPYTRDGIYTFDIDDWNLLYGLSGTNNIYGNEFLGMKRIKFEIKTDEEPPPYENLYQGKITRSMAIYDIINNIRVLKLTNPGLIPVNSNVVNRDDEPTSYTGFAPNCYIELPDVDLINNVTFNEVDYNTQDQTGIETNSWTVADGIVNDGTDIINSNQRSIKSLNTRDSFVWPTLGGTLSNSLNLLSNYTKTIDGDFVFDINEFNNSSENTFGKNFLGVRSFRITAPEIPMNEVLNVDSNGTYTPENGYVFNEVNVNVPNELTSNVLRSNGVYRFTRDYSNNVIGWNEIEVDVPSSSTELMTFYVTNNGDYTAEQGKAWNHVIVDVNNGGSGGDGNVNNLQWFNVHRNGSYNINNYNNEHMTNYTGFESIDVWVNNPTKQIILDIDEIANNELIQWNQLPHVYAGDYNLMPKMSSNENRGISLSLDVGTVPSGYELYKMFDDDLTTFAKMLPGVDTHYVEFIINRDNYDGPDAYISINRLMFYCSDEFGEFSSYELYGSNSVGDTWKFIRSNFVNWWQDSQLQIYRADEYFDQSGTSGSDDESGNETYRVLKFVFNTNNEYIQLNKLVISNNYPVDGIYIRNKTEKQLENLSVSFDGTYTAPSGKGYKTVSVNTGSSTAKLISSVPITTNGEYTIQDYNNSLTPVGDYNAFTSVDVSVPTRRMESLYVNSNGVYTPYNDEFAYNRVEVDVVPNSTNLEIYSNGTYNAPPGLYYDSIYVNVPQEGGSGSNIVVNELFCYNNGIYNPPSGTAYGPVTVQVDSPAPNLLNNYSVTKNGTFNVSNYNLMNNTNYDGIASVNVDVQNRLITKSLTVNEIIEAGDDEYMNYYTLQPINKRNDFGVLESNISTGITITPIVPENNDNLYKIFNISNSDALTLSGSLEFNINLDEYINLDQIIIYDNDNNSGISNKKYVLDVYGWDHYGYQYSYHIFNNMEMNSELWDSTNRRKYEFNNYSYISDYHKWKYFEFRISCVNGSIDIREIQLKYIVDGYNVVSINPYLPVENTKTVTYNTNGSYVVTPSSNYNYLKNVNINVNVPNPLDKVNIVIEDNVIKEVNVPDSISINIVEKQIVDPDTGDVSTENELVVETPSKTEEVAGVINPYSYYSNSYDAKVNINNFGSTDYIIFYGIGDEYAKEALFTSDKDYITYTVTNNQFTFYSTNSHFEITDTIETELLYTFNQLTEGFKYIIYICYDSIKSYSGTYNNVNGAKFIYIDEVGVLNTIVCTKNNVKFVSEEGVINVYGWTYNDDPEDDAYDMIKLWTIENVNQCSPLYYVNSGRSGPGVKQGNKVTGSFEGTASSLGQSCGAIDDGSSLLSPESGSFTSGTSSTSSAFYGTTNSSACSASLNYDNTNNERNRNLFKKYSHVTYHMDWYRVILIDVPYRGDPIRDWNFVEHIETTGGPLSDDSPWFNDGYTKMLFGFRCPGQPVHYWYLHTPYSENQVVGFAYQYTVYYS